MVWEQGSVVVVMTTRVMERSRTKCCQYWPAETETSATFGGFTVANNNMEENQDYVVSYLTLTNDKVMLDILVESLKIQFLNLLMFTVICFNKCIDIIKVAYL